MGERKQRNRRAPIHPADEKQELVRDIRSRLPFVAMGHPRLAETIGRAMDALEPVRWPQHNCPRCGDLHIATRRSPRSAGADKPYTLLDWDDIRRRSMRDDDPLVETFVDALLEAKLGYEADTGAKQREFTRYWALVLLNRSAPDRGLAITLWEPRPSQADAPPVREPGSAQKGDCPNCGTPYREHFVECGEFG